MDIVLPQLRPVAAFLSGLLIYLHKKQNLSAVIMSSIGFIDPKFPSPPLFLHFDVVIHWSSEIRHTKVLSVYLLSDNNYRWFKLCIKVV